MIQEIALYAAIISGSLLAIIIGRIVWIYWLGFRSEAPLLDREWVSDCAHLSTAKINNSKIQLNNVRDFEWKSKREYDEKWINTTVDVDNIRNVWFVVDHFHPKIKGMAHTMLSFEFKDNQYISFSFETRREVGERYHPWDGMWRAYELYLLVATEKDALHLRTNMRGNKVHLFRAQTPPGKDKALFLALCDRINNLAETPEWYHTITSTCTTSIVDQVNLITPGRIPRMWRTLLPGYSAKAAWKLKLIEDWGGFDATMLASRVDDKAKEWDGKEKYSMHIRRHMPPKSR